LDEYKSKIERDNLEYGVIQVENEDDKKQKLIEYIKDSVLDSCCIVFVRTTKKAEDVSKLINQEI
jgi:superfamily II DNA/RNA helicase